MPKDVQGTELSCHECGEPMHLTATGVSHHGTPDEIDHDADADHVALDDSQFTL